MMRHVYLTRTFGRKPSGGAGAGACDCGVVAGFIGGQPLEDRLQGVRLGQPFSDANVVVGQFTAGALPVWARELCAYVLTTWTTANEERTIL